MTDHVGLKRQVYNLPFGTMGSKNVRIFLAFKDFVSFMVHFPIEDTI
jgi:hypothetical protein